MIFHVNLENRRNSILDYRIWEEIYTIIKKKKLFSSIHIDKIKLKYNKVDEETERSI